MKTLADGAPDRAAMDKVIKKYRGRPGELLSILEEIQGLDKHKYLSQDTLSYVAQKTGIPASRIYSVATFYSFFNLKPQGDHAIVICRGTACHTRGSRNLLEYLKQLLSLKEDGADESEKVFLTTRDNKFTLKTVACFGQCALAPVVEIDGHIYGHMTENKVALLIKNLNKGRKDK